MLVYSDSLPWSFVEVNDPPGFVISALNLDDNYDQENSFLLLKLGDRNSRKS